MTDSTVSASLNRTLLPAVTDTVTVKTYEGGDTDSTAATEISYQLRETDQVWLGLSSLTVQRGDRYNGNTEETLRVYHYGSDAMRDAILECVRQQKSSAADDSSDFCRERAQSFLEQLRAVLG